MVFRKKNSSTEIASYNLINNTLKALNSKMWVGGLVWFGLVYLFIHSVTLDRLITDYNLQHNL